MGYSQSMKVSERRVVEKRARLIAVWTQTGNVALAMRKSGFASRRSAYRWIRRYEAEGLEGLASRSHEPRKSTTPEDLQKRILRLKALNPSLGRRTIAGQLDIGADRVAGVLRRSGLSRPESLRTTTVLSGPSLTDEGWLSRLRRGVTSGLSDKPDKTIRLLQPVLDSLRANLSWRQYARDGHCGPWILRGHLQLGHAFMNAGLWDDAELWLQRSAQLATSLADDKYTGWSDLGLPLSAVPRGVAVEAHEYLATILREGDPRRAKYHCLCALAGLVGGSNDENAARTLGNLLRADARLSILDGRSDYRTVEAQLQRSRSLLAQAGDALMQAATDMQLANLASAVTVARGENGRVEINRLLGGVHEVVQKHDSPILEVNFAIDSLRLKELHGMLDRGDETSLQAAAVHVVSRGYADQARKLLTLQSSMTALPLADFRSVALVAARRRSTS